MDGTILGQGTFTASYSGTNPNPGVAAAQAGDPVIIKIPSNADWVKVYDYTQAGTAGNSAAWFNAQSSSNTAVEWYWQRGMAAGTGIVRYKANAAATLAEDTMVSGGFTLFDPSGQSANQGALPIVGLAVATTASTNATRPVVSTASTAGMAVGTVVRMNSTAQTDVNGIDMVVGAVTANTNFTLLTATNALATAPGAIGGAGFYRIINIDDLFYPRHRYVVNITKAVNANVSTSVAHGLTPGQEVRFNIPAVSGMIELNPTNANNFEPVTILTVVDDYNFTIDVDTTGFNSFTWPTIAQQPSSFPQVIPFGENTGVSLITPANQVPSIAGVQINGTQTGLLADATTNTGFLGMILGSGGLGVQLSTTYVFGPSGGVHFSSGDVIDVKDKMYWVAGKSSYGGL